MGKRERNTLQRIIGVKEGDPVLVRKWGMGLVIWMDPDTREKKDMSIRFLIPYHKTSTHGDFIKEIEPILDPWIRRALIHFWKKECEDFISSITFSFGS